MKLAEGLKALTERSREDNEKYNFVAKLAVQSNLPGDDVLNHTSMLATMLPDRMRAAALAGKKGIVVLENLKMTGKPSFDKLYGVALGLYEWAHKHKLGIGVGYAHKGNQADEKNIQLTFFWLHKGW